MCESVEGEGWSGMDLCQLEREANFVVWFEADDYGSYWVGELYCCAGRSIGNWIF